MTARARAALIRALPFPGGQVAQLVEQRIENPRVGGSIPPLATSPIKVLGKNDTDVKCLIMSYMDAALMTSDILMFGMEVASATIATFFGRRKSMSLSHGSIARSARPCVSNTLRAPWIKSVLKYGSPHLLMPSNFTRPPVPDCRGTRPRKAANSRPERKPRVSATVATTAVAVSLPTPGIAASR